ncbi:nSTAND1 domain-containing NTPase [Microlunatus ginsengisoli]|uniref:Novel STAND NTPase 1 domain-containing protein n=1 Tax=Microlunatus ginsengisoli TaxID=363863 RepID=A0ABP6ZL81_9ACTN
MTDGVETGALPDPALINSREDLATALTALRQAANLSVREVVAASAVPHGTVSGWMSGQHAPVGAYRDRFDAVIVACGVTSPADREAWWEAAGRARQARSSRGVDGRPPYQGLQAFETGDSAWFFGRDQLIDRALRQLVGLSERVAGGPPALMTVIGASGSGKSSLIRAGIIPALGRRALDGSSDPVLDTWRALVMTPGAHPSETLAALTVTRQTVLCIDQFEELWTQVEDDAERTAFLESLLRLAEPGQEWIVLIGLRADFYAAASRRPELQQALQECQLLVGPMTSVELRSAIVEPASRAGARVDEDLVKVLLGDLASRSVTAAHDPGALPLLSHALLSTWERSNHRRMTVSDYYATGGIAGAIEQAAESTYERLSPEQQDCVPRLFLRLINLDGNTISRRRLQLGEVLDDSNTDAAMAAAIDAYCAARLLTRDVDSVEITHEALTTAWPRFTGWIASNRAGLVIHRRITLAARQWAAAGRDDGHLLPAARLSSWYEWARLEGHSADLNRLEREFLKASEDHHRREAAAAERQHRSRRRLGTMAFVLAVLCALLAVATTGAYLNARHYRAVAEAARDEARSRQVALQAAKLRTEDPALSSQLALAAYRISPTLEARSALMDATAQWTPTRLTGHPGPLQARTSPDGDTLATADAAGRLRLFSLAEQTPRRVADVAAAIKPPDLYALAWSDDGRLLAVGGQSAPTLWDVSDRSAPRRLRTLGVEVTTYALAFVPGTHRLLAGTSDGRVVGWTDPARSDPVDLVRGVADGVSAIAVSADGRRLAVAGAADRIDVWRLDAGRAVHRRSAALGVARALAIAFSPDGREVAAGTTGNEVRRWAIGRNGLTSRPALGGFGSWVNAVAYQPDARRLVAGSSDQTTVVFDLVTGRRLSVMPGPAIVVSVQVAGGKIVTGSSDGTSRLWPLPDPTTHDAVGPGWQLGESTDQRLLAEATGRGDGTLRLYDLGDDRRADLRATVAPPAGQGTISGTGTLSPDGSLLAGGTTTGRIVLWGTSSGQPTLLGSVSHVGSDHGAADGPPSQLQALAISRDNRLLASVDATRAYVALWDISNPMSPRREPATLPAGAIALTVAFDPDGTMLAVGDAADEVVVWNVGGPKKPQRLATLTNFQDDVNAVAFSPNGRLLAAGGADRSLRVWDVSDHDRPRLVSSIEGPEAAVVSVAFSAAGDRLAVGSADGTLWLYDLADPATPIPAASLGAAGERVNDARFVDHDGGLVGTGPSGALRFWQTDTAAAIDQICARRGDPLDAQEWRRYLAGIPVRQIC